MVVDPCLAFSEQRARRRLVFPPHAHQSRYTPSRHLEQRNLKLGSEHDDARVLGLVLGLDMDRNQGVLDLRLEHPLNRVTNVVRLRYAHLTGHDQVKVDEGAATRMTCAQVMGLEGSG